MLHRPSMPSLPSAKTNTIGFVALLALAGVIVHCILGYELHNFNVTNNRVALFRHVPILDLDHMAVGDSAMGSLNPADSTIEAEYFKEITKSTYNTNVKGRLQLVKAQLGCYGYVDNLWDLDEAALNAKQAANGGNAAFSVCKCIDENIWSITKETSVGANAVTKPSVQSAGNARMDYTRFSICDVTNNDTVAANAACSNHLRDFEKRIIADCSVNAVPQSSLSYEGVLDTHMFSCSALVLLVASAFGGYFLNRNTNEYQTTLTNKSEKNVRQQAKSTTAYFMYISALVTFALFLLNFIYIASRDSGVAESKTHLWYRPDTGFTNYSELPLTLTFYFLVASVVQLVCAYYYKNGDANKYEQSMKAPGQTSFSETLYCQIFIDIGQIVGFSVLGVNTLARASVNNVEHLYFTLVLLSTLAFLQHLSNVGLHAYINGGRLLSNANVIDLQTKDTNDEVLLSEQTVQRKLFQFLVWSRLYVFSVVVLLSLSFALSAPQVADVNRLLNANSSYVVYFVFFFILASIGYDIVYEILPGYFVDDLANAEFRAWVIFIYTFWFVIQHCTYLWFTYSYRLPAITTTAT